MHQSLGEDDGMYVDGFRTIAFSYCHLTRTSHEVAHDDEQIVHHGSKEKYKGDDAHNPSHHLDVRVLGIYITEHREIIVQIDAHLLQLLQREMIFSHLFHEWLQFVRLMSLG